MSNLTLGSLFDGSGGFPLAGMMAGITPIWASEIEPFSIRVTTKRIPQMKHYGDISKMNGGKIEPVDIITFGSPCQNLSLAGKREGLNGEKSSMFFEAIRVIKEMRENTNGEYPRWIVWENVPGAMSSSKGQDLGQSLKKSAKSKIKPYIFLCLRRNGQPQEKLWEMIIPLPIEYSMRNTSESLKDAEESFLSQILQENVPEKYYLSQRACSGILRRASARGKELPELLKRALEKQAQYV